MYYLEWEELGGVIVNNRVTEEIIKNINELLNKYYAQNYKNTRVIVDINPNNLS